MPEPLVAYVRVIEKFVARLWMGLRWVTMMIIGVLAYAVIVRHGLGVPSITAYELAMFTMTIGFFIAGGPLLLQEEHVRMDALYSKWSTRRKAIMDIATFVLFIYIIVMVYTSISATFDSYASGQHTKSIWSPPLWPLKAGMATGCLILLLQAIANLIRDIATIRGKPIPGREELE
jgi:TRAP-type mannitol/chloroaromatic compound transport system permease small subunit